MARTECVSELPTRQSNMHDLRKLFTAKKRCMPSMHSWAHHVITPAVHGCREGTTGAVAARAKTSLRTISGEEQTDVKTRVYTHISVPVNFITSL